MPLVPQTLAGLGACPVKLSLQAPMDRSSAAVLSVAESVPKSCPPSAKMMLLPVLRGCCVSFHIFLSDLAGRCRWHWNWPSSLCVVVAMPARPLFPPSYPLSTTTRAQLLHQLIDQPFSVDMLFNLPAPALLPPSDLCCFCQDPTLCPPYLGPVHGAHTLPNYPTACAVRPCCRCTSRQPLDRVALELP
eukprot:46313-Chlamydomonas_euryale.AAC.3